MGHGSDVTGRRTPWIIGGMAVLAAGGVLAALATVWMGSSPAAGIALAVAAFVLIGLGVGAAGTSLLVLLAKRVAADRRAAAATAVWLMMIVGFAVTAGVSGKLLDPYTPARLLQVCGGVCALALCLSLLAVWGVETAQAPAAPAEAEAAKPSFRDALAQVWADSDARRFTIFVFVSMLAYSAQDLILEPFAGMVHGYTPGESTQLSGVQHGGVLMGMLMAAFAGRRLAGTGPGLAARLGGGRLHRVGRRHGRPGGRRTAGPGLAAARHGVRAGRVQRRVLDRRHRRHDGPGHPGRTRPRGRAHGPVGRGAGRGLRHGWPAGRGRQ
jgi:BCD family chlorophyll transporter-like MFS transporter